MERKNVVLSDADMARQREFTEKIKDLHIQRGKAVHALVDTFGCQQNVADSQHIMGMLEARIDQIQRLCVQKLMIAQIRGHKGVAAQRDGLTDIVAAGTAPHRHAVDRPAAVHIAQTITA